MRQSDKEKRFRRSSPLNPPELSPEEMHRHRLKINIKKQPEILSESMLKPLILIGIGQNDCDLCIHIAETADRNLIIEALAETLEMMLAIEAKSWDEEGSEIVEEGNV